MKLLKELSDFWNISVQFSIPPISHEHRPQKGVVVHRSSFVSGCLSPDRPFGEAGARVHCLGRHHAISSLAYPDLYLGRASICRSRPGTGMLGTNDFGRDALVCSTCASDMV